MHILHVSSSSSSADGGISTVVSQLVDFQRRSSSSVMVSWLCLDELFQPLLPFHYIYVLLTNRPDIVHVHGLWRLPSRFFFLYRLLNIHVVVSPHGMLHPRALQISPLKKKLSYFLFEKHLFSCAKVIHALNDYESSSVSHFCGDTDVTIIPNGICLYPRSGADCRELLSMPADSNILLYFGRYHPGKNIDLLARSWQEIIHLVHPSWWLVFVGYGDETLLEQFRPSHSSRIKICGPFFGADKHLIFSSVNAFILPSAFEALPMAALEAMSYSLPCLLTDECNLSSAFDVGAAYRINSSNLSRDLLSFFAMSSEDLSVMGKRAHALASKEYSWVHITELFLMMYRSVIA